MSRHPPTAGIGKAQRWLAAAEGGLYASALLSLASLAGTVLATSSPLGPALMLASFASFAASFPATVILGCIAKGKRTPPESTREPTLLGFGSSLLAASAVAGLVLTTPAFKPAQTFNEAATDTRQCPPADRPVQPVPTRQIARETYSHS